MDRPLTPIPELTPTTEVVDVIMPIIAEEAEVVDVIMPIIAEVAKTLTTVVENDDNNSNTVLVTGEVTKPDSNTSSKSTSSSALYVVLEDGPISENNDEINKSALKKVKDHLEYFNIKIDDDISIMFILKTIMEIVENIKDNKFKGIAKKECVLYVVRTIIVNSSLSDDKKTMVITLIDNGTMSSTIDIIVDASKGNIGLNKKTKKRIFKCMRLCSTGLSK